MGFRRCEGVYSDTVSVYLKWLQRLHPVHLWFETSPITPLPRNSQFIALIILNLQLLFLAEHKASPFTDLLSLAHFKC